MKKLFFLILVSNLCLSCVVQKSIGNGAFSDLSLNVNSDKYEIKRLKEIQASGNAFWGIPEPVDKKQGIVFRFNGIKIPSTGQFLPFISLVGSTFILGNLINSARGFETIFNADFEDSFSSLLLALPIAGTINNLSFPNSASSVASMNLNRELIENNRDIDVFLNPKYEISFSNGLWNQKANISAKIMGAKILVNEPNYSEIEKKTNQVDKITAEDLDLIMKDFKKYSNNVKLKRGNNLLFQAGEKYYKSIVKQKEYKTTGYYVRDIFVFDSKTKNWIPTNKNEVIVTPNLIKGYSE